MSPSRKGDSILIWKSPKIMATKSPAWTIRRPVPQSDTGVLGEYPKAFGRTLVN
jgi:hypothetical protein